MKAPTEEERALTVAPWLVISTTIAALLFMTGWIGTTYAAGLTSVSVAFGLLCVVGVLGVADAATRRVVLARDHLRVVSMWSRRIYARGEIRSVTWEGGVGAALKLVSGRWVRLPELGRNSQIVANTVRAWLKRTEPREESSAGRQ